ncbi:MAG: DUF4232 domain-containing protein [Actinomycetota bacterium]|nr:DUF4232 domain-containing protein [Actinomycetota bacterium]
MGTALFFSLLLASCATQGKASLSSASTTSAPDKGGVAGYFANPASAPECTAGQLSVSFAQVGQAAGTVAGEMVFTNTSSSYCHLSGWPSVVGVVGQTGATTTASKAISILGRPAGKNSARAALAVPHKSVYALFSVPTGVDYGPQCGPAFTYLRVTPPGTKTAIKVSASLPGINKDMPGCPGLAVTPVVGNAAPPVPAATTTTTVPSGEGMPACAGQHLQVSMGRNGAAAGTVFVSLQFKNVSSLPCSLQGWPSVVGELASGAQVAASKSDQPPLGMDQTAPSAVLLPANGGVAEAQLAGSDVPSSGVGECPTFTYLLIAAPGTGTTSRIPAFVPNLGVGMPDCRGLSVTWVVPYQAP